MSVQQIETVTRTWRPDKNEGPNPLIGRVGAVTCATGLHGDYPLVEIITDSGDIWVFHAMREIAEKELKQLSPEIGDQISVHWQGVPEGKKYHRYRIRAVGAGARKVNWDRFSTERDAPEVEPAPIPTPTARDGEPVPVNYPGDEDIPF